MTTRASLISLSLVGLLAFTASASATVIYDTIPSTLPGNVPSLGYEATSTTEFGDRIGFAGTQRQLTSVTVTMSDWANYADYQSMSSSGWTHPLTFNIYNVGPGHSVGGLIYSTTVNASIPWHDLSSGPNGTAFNVVFGIPNVIVPDEIIFGLAYNTGDYGVQPIGTPGPYNSLNFGLVQVAPTVGTDVNPDNLFWNTSFAGFLTPPSLGGFATAGIFSEDTAWSPYRQAVRFEADPVPEPSSLLILASLALASFGLFGYRLRSRRA